MNIEDEFPQETGISLPVDHRMLRREKSERAMLWVTDDSTSTDINS
jgi:hypothetical protein